MERYQDKKVVIVGGTSGMGLATAKMLLDGGARVLVTGRSQAGLESAQKELGKDALVVSSDARSLTEIDALASRIRVNAVTPGPIDTPILGKAYPGEGVAAQIREKMIGMSPMKRWGTSDEIAKAVLFLAFDATYTTGHELPVDGGMAQL